MMLEMIFGHKQFFDCDPRHYAKLRFTHVRYIDVHYQIG